MTESELDEVEEQLTGKGTTRNLAEFKARKNGDKEMADAIRNNNVTDA